MKHGQLSSCSRRIRVVAIMFCCLIFQFAGVAFPVHGAISWPKDDTQLIGEALEQIRLHALMPPKSTPRMTKGLLRTYVQSLDEYSDYLTKEEYRGFRESVNSDYFGVHMDIQKKGGIITLFPFKRGIAEKGGIQPGDELIAVNGEPVFGKSVFVVGSQIRGKEGEVLQLTIRSGRGLMRTLTLRRKQMHFASVQAKNTPQAHYIQITRFMDDTDKMLLRNLNGIGNDSKTIVIDLRGNQGGSLYAAQRCAEFFLEKGSLLYKLRSNAGTRAIVAENAQITNNDLVLIQDHNTASAAEAFIAALTGNGRALSVGQTSYGKGLVQRFLPLSDGSALFLTHQEIISSDNLAYNGRGLDPDILLSQRLQDEDFSQEEALIKLFTFISSFGVDLTSCDYVFKVWQSFS